MNQNSINNTLNNTLNNKIIIIDDDLEMRTLLQDFLLQKKHNIECYQNPIEFLNTIQAYGENLKTIADKTENIELVISDIKMPQMNGLELTKILTSIAPDIPIILITGFGSIESAIEAMKAGAFHYIVKPFKLAEIEIHIEKALENRKLKKENLILKNELQKSYSKGMLLGKSQAMKEIFELIDRIANAHANVLITGESGTGKELVARAIHEKSSRKNFPFIAINCSAIPETLLESELFGYAKGAFTGAHQRKKGLFEEANGGTLFLDEIGDLNITLQAKLLRVIQDKTIRAIGDTTDKPIDVRIITATHKDLKNAIKEGRFREDLYYRLAVIPIVMPPLRHRKEDIPILAQYFLQKYKAINNSNVKGFTPQALEKLMNMHWQGNVRELENMIERLVVLSNKNLIDAQDIPTNETADFDQFISQNFQKMPDLAQLERHYINFILDKTGGKKEKAAQILGINRRTLYRKEKEYGLNFHDNQSKDDDDKIS